MRKLFYPLLLLLVFWLVFSVGSRGGQEASMEMAQVSNLNPRSSIENVVDAVPLASISNFDQGHQQLFAIIVIMMASIVLALRRRRYHGAFHRRS